MEKTTICLNCRATFEIHSDKCPYCGYINEVGAEEKYMRNMSDIRERLDYIDNEARDEYKKEIAVIVKRILKILACICVPIIVIMAIYNGTRKIVVQEKNYDMNDPARLADNIKWRRDNFEIYDELYAAGEYDKLAEMIKSPETQSREVYLWEHYDFISIHSRYLEVRDKLLSELVEEGSDEFLASGMIYDCFYYYYEVYINEYAIHNKLTEEELKLLDQNREFMVEVIHERMKFSDEQMHEFKDSKQVLSDQFLAYNDCKKLGKKYYSQFE